MWLGLSITGKPRRREAALQGAGALLVPIPFEVAALQVPNAGDGAGDDGGCQRGGEDEAGCIGADGIAAFAAGGNVATHEAKAFGQRTLDDVDLGADAVAFGDAAAGRAVEPDRVHFVEIGDGIVAAGEVADLPDRRNVAVHRIDGLEGDDLGRVRGHRLELPLQVRKVIVPPDPLWSTTMPNALDHRGMVLGVGEDRGVSQQAHQRGQRGMVGDVARSKQQRRVFAVQARQFCLEFNVVVGGPGDVARAARAGADPIDRLVHGREHLRVLAHAEVVVRAPDDDVAHIAIVMEMLRRWEAAAHAPNIRKDAIATFLLERAQRLSEFL